MPAAAHPKEILRRMACDKKNKNGVKYIVMLESIGDSGNCAHPVEDDDILRVLSPGVELIPAGYVISMHAPLYSAPVQCLHLLYCSLKSCCILHLLPGLCAGPSRFLDPNQSLTVSS